MDVSDWLFYVLWLLPGVVLGVLGTLVTQSVVRSLNVDKASEKSKHTENHRKVNSKLFIHDQTGRADVGSGDEPLMCFLSATKRVRKTKTCSNMAKFEPVQLCAKCFKLP